MIASSIAGALATVAGHPDDSIKVRMAAFMIKQNTFRTMYNMIKNEGMYT